jgi:UDP-galactopyranose mutase
MNTYKQLWDVHTPKEAQDIINKQKITVSQPKNVEEQALSLVGEDIYNKLIKGYTEKQWGRVCSELPASILNRIPVRYTFDNNYYNDTYQGIPIGGYNTLMEKLLDGIAIKLNVDYLSDSSYWNSLADKVVYTGRIDAYYDYAEGTLAYRSMRWEDEVIDHDNYQGNAIVNYTDAKIPYTRIIEHKHFEFGTQPKTVISKEYPSETKSGDEPHYPIADSTNLAIYAKYKNRATKEANIIFGGRLATYKYYDMHQVIASALAQVKKKYEDY